MSFFCRYKQSARHNLRIDATTQAHPPNSHPPNPHPPSTKHQAGFTVSGTSAPHLLELFRLWCPL